MHLTLDYWKAAPGKGQRLKQQAETTKGTVTWRSGLAPCAGSCAALGATAAERSAVCAPLLHGFAWLCAMQCCGERGCGGMREMAQSTLPILLDMRLDVTQRPSRPQVGRLEASKRKSKSELCAAVTGCKPSGECLRTNRLFLPVITPLLVHVRIRRDSKKRAPTSLGLYPIARLSRMNSALRHFSTPFLAPHLSLFSFGMG